MKSGRDAFAARAGGTAQHVWGEFDGGHRGFSEGGHHVWSDAEHRLTFGVGGD